MASVVRRPLQRPNCCFICETTTSERFFDTRRNFDPPGRVDIKGRRYICEKCVDQAARAFEYIRPKDAADLRDAVAAAEARAAQAEVERDAFKAIAEASEILAPRKVSRAKKAASESAEASAE